MTLRSAPKSTRPAVVLVKYARKVKTGDSLDVWFDFDGDKVPDLHLSGDAFSEFTVHKAKSFTKDGKDISNDDVARLAMAGSTSKVRLFPARLGTVRRSASRWRSSRRARACPTAPTTGRRRRRSSPRRCWPPR